MALAVAVLHLAVPWALRWSIAAPHRVAYALLRGDGAYSGATIGLAALALLLADHGFPDFWGAWAVPSLGAAVVVGIGFPFLFAALVRRPRRFARLPERAGRTVLCATAEEVLWRFAALGFLIHAGMPVVVAPVLSLAGFVLLHVPQNGWRVVYYQALFGVALTAFALVGGVIPAALCHCAHNLVMAATSRRTRAQVAAVPVELPPSQSWGTGAESSSGVTQ